MQHEYLTNEFYSTLPTSVRNSHASRIRSEFSNIIANYTHESRFYHTLDHIEDMLRLFDAYSTRIPLRSVQIQAIKLAIFFHDYMYSFGIDHKNNEENSALRFVEFARSIGLEFSVINDVEQIIILTNIRNLATEDISNAPYHHKIFVDLDLSILGTNFTEYDQYSANIRKEYNKLNDSHFSDARINILQLMLNKKSIYVSNFLPECYETRRKENLQREIKKLQSIASNSVK